MVDLTYSYMQHSKSYDAVMQLDKNPEEFNKAMLSLKGRLDGVFEKTKVIKKQLAEMLTEEKM